MIKWQKGERLEVKIEKLIFGGAGLARHSGRVLFVDYAVPGDELEVEIVEVKKNFARAKILTVMVPSAQRREAPCSVFTQCGGCQWQQVQYSGQLEAKQQILKEVLHRFLGGESVSLDPFLPSPREWNYRNRIQVKARDGLVGFYAKGSHELVPVRECFIAEEKLNRALAALIDEEPQAGQYRLQLDLGGKVSTTNTDSLEEPLGFAQVNNEQNQELQKEIKKVYLKDRLPHILDLYGGYGNFSLPLAEEFPEVKVESVEWNRQATEMGLRLSREKRLTNIRFSNGDVGAYLNRLRVPEDSFVILDPPREGCSQGVIEALAHHGPSVVVYISCDPMTWGRDAQLFLREARGQGYDYRIATIHGLDMFPQTDHIEVFSVFERKSSFKTGE